MESMPVSIKKKSALHLHRDVMRTAFLLSKRKIRLLIFVTFITLSCSFHQLFQKIPEDNPDAPAEHSFLFPVAR